jgi:glucosamine-6-phosphate deaminase
MATAPLRVLATPEALGEALADRILQRMEEARVAGRPFVLGSPTGRTPRPIYAAMARRLAAHPQDLSHVTVVMMDEYLVPSANGLAYAPADEPWSCHYFARVEIAASLNAVLRPEHRLNDANIWFPTPNDSGAYDDRIAAAGGIDIFLLASGASDGHVAFNPPGSPRESRSRVIPLSEATRRDNLQTFPTFGSLDRVPRHGVSVGISTIVSAREALMVVWGSGKGLTLSRMLAAERYQADWPATLVHECARGEIIADEAAASACRNKPP